MRVLVLATVACVALVVPSAEAAAGETCQGEPATIVQTEGSVQGTDGDDVIFASGDQGTAGLFVDAGKGNDLICFGGHLPEGVTSIDAWLDLDGGPGTDSLVYVGSEGVDNAWAFDVEHVDIRTGEGVDKVWLSGRSSLSGVVDGGLEASHANTLWVSNYTKTGNLTIDLVAQEMRSNGAVTAVAGFAEVKADARTVRLDGDGLANRFQVTACDAKVRGGDGDDDVRASRTGGCDDFAFKLVGQDGDDRLRGSVKNDVLLGGQGKDVANGRGGRDRCKAEVERQCER